MNGIVPVESQAVLSGSALVFRYGSMYRRFGNIHVSMNLTSHCAISIVLRYRYAGTRHLWQKLEEVLPRLEL